MGLRLLFSESAKLGFPLAKTPRRLGICLELKLSGRRECKVFPSKGRNKTCTFQIAAYCYLPEEIKERR